MVSEGKCGGIYTLVLILGTPGVVELFSSQSLIYLRAKIIMLRTASKSLVTDPHLQPACRTTLPVDNFQQGSLVMHDSKPWQQNDIPTDCNRERNPASLPSLVAPQRRAYAQKKKKKSGCTTHQRTRLRFTNPTHTRLSG